MQPSSISTLERSDGFSWNLVWEFCHWEQSQCFPFQYSELNNNEPGAPTFKVVATLAQLYLGDWNYIGQIVFVKCQNFVKVTLSERETTTFLLNVIDVIFLFDDVN